jgi:hypothetical protein
MGVLGGLLAAIGVWELLSFPSLNSALDGGVIIFIGATGIAIAWRGYGRKTTPQPMLS